MKKKGFWRTAYKYVKKFAVSWWSMVLDLCLFIGWINLLGILMLGYLLGGLYVND